MRWLMLVVLATGCFGQVERSPEVEQELGLSCGAMPDPALCEVSERFVSLDGCPSLVCDGWPENPYGTPEQYVQVVGCDGTRSVHHVATSMVVCQDGER